jgi:uncharacterized membrane protein
VSDSTAKVSRLLIGLTWAGACLAVLALVITNRVSWFTVAACVFVLTQGILGLSKVASPQAHLLRRVPMLVVIGHVLSAALFAFATVVGDQRIISGFASAVCTFGAVVWFVLARRIGANIEAA